MTPSTLVISPHLDDAVFSLGRMLARLGPQALVLTVHGGGSDERVREDTQALMLLGCSSARFPAAPDEPIPGMTAGLAALSREYRKGFSQVLVPLGIYHPDHVAVADACRAVDWRGASVGVYEELPYRVLWPDQAYHRRRAWGFADGGEPETQAGPRDLKATAVECYATQLDDDVRDAVMCPERVWWL